MTARLLVNAAWDATRSASLPHLAATVTAAGADGVALPDSPQVFADPLVLTERLLGATEVPLAGPCVLGLGLRHPAAVAGSLTTLAGAYPSRVFAVLARGESAVRNEGLAPPRLGEYLRRVGQVSDRLGSAARDMTLLGAASGPRTLAATAARLPGVLIDVGTHPEAIARAVASARAAREDVGCWLFVRAVTTATETQREAAVAPLLGSCAARLVAAPQWYGVPAAMHETLHGLAATHDYTCHGRAQHSPAGSGAEFVADRFFLTGSSDDLAAAAAGLSATGIDGVVLAGALGGLPERLAETVTALARGLGDRAITSAEGEQW